MTTMRTDAKETLKLCKKLSNDEVEYALGNLLLSKVYADKVLALLTAYATQDDDTMLVKALYASGIAYKNTQQNLREEFNKK